MRAFEKLQLYVRGEHVCESGLDPGVRAYTVQQSLDRFLRRDFRETLAESLRLTVIQL